MDGLGKPAYPSSSGGNSRLRIFILQTIPTLVLLWSCSPEQRIIPGDEDTEQTDDTGTETETAPEGGVDTDTELIWNPSNANFTIAEPVMVFEEVSDYDPGHTALAFDGTTIALSRSDVAIVPPIPDFAKHTLFITFPWNSPQDAIVNSFDQGESVCPYLSYSWWAPNSVPFPHPNGFVLITTTDSGTPGGCEVMTSVWDNEANLLEDPIAYKSLFPEEAFYAMDPNGIVDDAGVVTTANLKGIDFNSGGDQAGSIVIDVDRLGSGGFHERLAHHAYYPWPDTLGLNNRVTSGWSSRNVYPHDGSLTVLAMELNGDYYIEFESSVVLAGIGADGGLETEPVVVLDQPPALIDPAWGEPFSFFTFAQHPGGIMVLAKTHYLDHNEPEYDDLIADPHPIGYWTRLMGFHGEPLTEWTFLAQCLSHVWHNKARIAWSGKYYGVCYNDPFETHRFVLLDENGAPVYDPVDLFWPIPPVENRLLPCDVIAVNEDTFIVSMYVYTLPQQAYANGIWISRVTVNDVE